MIVSSGDGAKEMANIGIHYPTNARRFNLVENVSLNFFWQSEDMMTGQILIFDAS